MYLSDLKYWDQKTWRNKLKGFSTEEQSEIKQILTLSTKGGVESGFKRLQQLGFINGIGPSWFTSRMRRFITWLFPYFRSEFHDIGYWIGGEGEQKKNFDKGMLKYTILSIQKISEKRIDNGNVFIIGYDLFVSVPFKYLLSFFFYITVRIFGIWSFDYDKYYSDVVFIQKLITIMTVILLFILIIALGIIL